MCSLEFQLPGVLCPQSVCFDWVRCFCPCAGAQVTPGGSVNSGSAFAWTVLMESDSHRLASCPLSSCEPACMSIVAVHARLQAGHVINPEN